MGTYADLTVALDDEIDPDWGDLVRDCVLLRFASSAARTSELPTLGSSDAGMQSFIVDDKRIDIWDGSAWVLKTFTPPFLRAEKSADDTVSSISSQDDDHLVLTIPAGAATGAKYHVTGKLFVTGAAAQDVIPLFTLPTSATMDVANLGLQTGVTGSDTYGYAEMVARLAQTSPTTGVTYGTSGGITTIHLDGTLTMATTTGPLRVQWAPAVAGNVTVKKGSWLEAARKS